MLDLDKIFSKGINPLIYQSQYKAMQELKALDAHFDGITAQQEQVLKEKQEVEQVLADTKHELEGALKSLSEAQQALSEIKRVVDRFDRDRHRLERENVRLIQMHQDSLNAIEWLKAIRA